MFLASGCLGEREVMTTPELMDGLVTFCEGFADQDPKDLHFGDSVYQEGVERVAVRGNWGTCEYSISEDGVVHVVVDGLALWPAGGTVHSVYHSCFVSDDYASCDHASAAGSLEEIQSAQESADRIRAAIEEVMGR